MPHSVEVDQSNKIEQSGPTVLAFANGLSHAIVIPSDVKTEGRNWLRAQGKTERSATIILFAACLFCLFRNHLDLLSGIAIDVEYDGKDADIKAALLRYIWKVRPTFSADVICFRRVGKKSPADRKAANVRQGKDKQFRRVTIEELLSVLK